MSELVGNPDDRFSHNEAQMTVQLVNSFECYHLGKTKGLSTSVKVKGMQRLKLQIVKIQRAHMVNRVSSYFQKGGQPETELK